MTDPTTPLTAEAFDWNKVGPELEALGQAIADTIDPSNPMQSNESTMDCLEHLWSLGYRVVPHAAARRAIEGSGVVEAAREAASAMPADACPVCGSVCDTVLITHADWCPLFRLYRILAALPRDPVQGSGAPTNLPAPADRGGPEEPRVGATQVLTSATISTEEPRMERWGYDGLLTHRLPWRGSRATACGGTMPVVYGERSEPDGRACPVCLDATPEAR